MDTKSLSIGVVVGLLTGWALVMTMGAMSGVSFKRTLDDVFRQSTYSETLQIQEVIYDPDEKNRYRVEGTPSELVTVSFVPGEEVIDVAVSDRITWKVDETWSGKGSNVQTHLFIQPLKTNASTTMVVTTEQGLYHFDLMASEEGPVTHVRFRDQHKEFIKWMEIERYHRRIKNEQIK